MVKKYCYHLKILFIIELANSLLLTYSDIPEVKKSSEYSESRFFILKKFILYLHNVERVPFKIMH